MADIKAYTEKPTGTINHVEATDDATNSKDIVLDATLKGQAVSGYETLTPWETVKTFKLCTFLCFAVAFSAATDGYQIG